MLSKAMLFKSSSIVSVITLIFLCIPIFLFSLLKKYVLQHRYDSASQRFSFKILQKNSGIYLDVMYKVSTFAPALLERQSLIIDILLKSKGSENKNKKLSKKFGGYLKKSLSLHPLSQRKQARRKPRQFFEILINNTSSTRLKQNRQCLYNKYRYIRQSQ